VSVSNFQLSLSNFQVSVSVSAFSLGLGLVSKFEPGLSLGGYDLDYTTADYSSGLLTTVQDNCSGQLYNSVTHD